MLRGFILTLLALIAFAGNSVLNRLALAGGHIDPWSFSLIRLISGAIILYLICLWPNRQSDMGRASAEKSTAPETLPQAPLWKSNIWQAGSWTASLALLLYALCFSFAYIQLEAGTGALILFTSVQLSMIISAFIKGERLTWRQSIGVAMAMAGLYYLLRPETTPPVPLAALLMCIAGIAWGAYSVLGKTPKQKKTGHDEIEQADRNQTEITQNPIFRNAGNFIRASLSLITLSLILGLTSYRSYLSIDGVTLAIISGAITSGLGYAIWYAALRYISILQAAFAQLSVPLIAALGGIIFLGEAISLDFIIASLIILLGLSITFQQKPNKPPNKIANKNAQ